MGQIDTGRIVLGGLIAGLMINLWETTINTPILGAASETAYEALNMDMPGSGALAVLVLLGFLLGIATVWLYAAIRPRFGPGPKTAVMAGLAVWFFVFFNNSVGYGMMGLFPARLLMMTDVSGLVELTLAALAGALLYRES